MESAGDPVADWQKIEKFQEGIRCSQLKMVFITNNYDNFTFAQFYSDVNEKYRRLVANNQIKPASIYKRKISQMSSDRGRGRGRGRGGRGGRFNRGGGRGRGRGRGQGRGNYSSSNSSINWNLLQGIDPNGNLNFDDDTWYGFSKETRNEIDKLRKLQRQQRNINAIMSNYPAQDDNSTIASRDRDIFSISVPNQHQGGASLPPPPAEQQPQPPTGSQGSTRSNNAGAAFGPNR